MGRYDEEFSEVNARIDRLVIAVGEHNKTHQRDREVAAHAHLLDEAIKMVERTKMAAGVEHPTDRNLRERAELRRRAALLNNPRIVRVSYVNEHRIAFDQEWDYADGIGNLKIGDRVVTPRFQYPDCEGVVVAVDEPRRWQGNLKTITQRV